MKHAAGLLLLLLLGCSRPQTRSVSGTIEADEVRVASRYGGRVIALHAQEGDTLQPGQLIVELDARELQARSDQATARLNLALDEERRVVELFRQNVASDQERDHAVNRARLERAQLAEIEAQLREMQIVAPGGPRSVVAAAGEPNESVATERDPPLVLETLHVKVGDVLPAHREVATLLLPELWVRVYVPEPWLGRIQLGQKVNVRTDSSRELLTGEVVQIHRQAEFTPRNVQTVEDRVRQVFGVKVRLPSDTGKLRAGMSADVFFPDVPPVPR